MAPFFIRPGAAADTRDRIRPGGAPSCRLAPCMSYLVARGGAPYHVCWSGLTGMRYHGQTMENQVAWQKAPARCVVADTKANADEKYDSLPGWVPRMMFDSEGEIVRENNTKGDVRQSLKRLYLANSKEQEEAAKADQAAKALLAAIRDAERAEKPGAKRSAAARGAESRRY